jgi:hypothetical protein
MRWQQRLGFGPALGLCLLAASPGAAQDAPMRLALDREETFSGIGVACTGIGESKQDPRWQAYPLRIEFANERREYLIGAQVKLHDEAGRQLMDIACWGAWLLLRPPGRDSYRIEATMIGDDAEPQSATIRAPADGQARIVLQFSGVEA